MKEKTEKSKLEMFASPLKAKNNFIKASFGGFAGSGKTFTATQFIIGAYKEYGCKKPILLIDNEKGSRFLIPIFESAGIKVYVKDTVKLADVLEAMKLQKEGEIDFLFIDTLTKVWYDYINDYKLKCGNKKFMELMDWGKILPSWQSDFSDPFVQAEGNIVFTGRAGNKYEKEEDLKNEAGNVIKKGAFVVSGAKMKLAGETPFETDLNIFMELVQDITAGELTSHRTAQIWKDRSNLIDNQTFVNPTYKDFQPVVKFLIAVPKGDVMGSTDNTNLAPSENHEWYREKSAREKKFAEIKGLFDMYGFGTSKEDKQLKTTITDKVFGTTAIETIEDTRSDILTTKKEWIRIILENLDIIDKGRAKLGSKAEQDKEDIKIAELKLKFVKDCTVEYLESEVARIDNPLV